MVQKAKQPVENLSAEQVAAELEAGEALLVDLREPDKREQGAIPGAVCERAPRHAGVLGRP